MILFPFDNRRVAAQYGSPFGDIILIRITIYLYALVDSRNGV